MTEIELLATPVAISTEALFRYRIVAHVLARVAMGVVRADAIRELGGEDEEHLHLDSGRVRTFTTRTVYRWLAAYAKRGLVGLEPVSPTRPSSVPDALLAFMREEKVRDLYASVPELLRRATALGISTKLPKADKPLHRATAFRALRRIGLPLSATSSKRETDMRRFAFPNRMRMMLVDGKHFRAGQTRLRRVAFFYLDDCCRKVLTTTVVGGSGEKTKIFLRGLFELICRVGFPDLIYIDRGPAFFSNDAHAVLARLGIRFLHGKRRYPEGHAKVERFNRTAWADCIRGLRAPDVDPEPGALELRISHYVESQYNTRPHEGIGNVSPNAKWDADERPLRFPASVDALKELFFIAETRKVSLDNVIKVGGVNYEVPRGYAGAIIDLRRHAIDGHVCVIHHGRVVRVHPVDLAANAEARRASPTATSPREDKPDDEGEAPVTAAALAFNRDFGPVRPGGAKKLK